MIKSIHLENWKSHEDTDLEFASGTTVLIGAMGSGKTSVMDAISFALFGTFPALQSRKLKLDDCIMDKPEKKGDATIKLVFSLKENTYEVTRRIERGKGTTLSEFKKNDSVIESPNTQRVTEAITRELQVDYELFSRAVYSEQNQIDYFLQIPSGQRKRKIDELLKLDRFEKARSTLTSVINRLKSQAKDKEDALKDIESESLEKKLAELEKELEGIEEEKKKREGELARKKEEMEKLAGEVKSLEEKQEKARAIDNASSSIKGELTGLEEKAKEISEKLGKLLEKDLQPKREELQGRIKGIKKKIEELESGSLQKELSELNTKHGALKSKMDELEKKLEEREKLESKLEELRKTDWKKKLENEKEQVEKLNNQLTESRVAVKEGEKRLKELEKLEGHCPVCSSKITPEKRKELEEKAEKALKENKEKIAELEKKLETVDIDETEKKVNEVNKTTEKLAELDVEDELEKTKKAIRENEEQLKEKNKLQEKNNEEKRKLGEEKENYEQTLNKIEKAQELQEEHKKALEKKKSKTEERRKLEKQLEELHFDEKELRNKREEKEKLGSTLTELKTKKETDEKLSQEKKERLKELKTTQEQVKDWKEDLEFLRKNASSMETFRNALEATQVQLREETLEALNAGTADIWPKIYPYGDYTSLRLGIEGGDYMLQVRRRDGNWINVEGTASGGERSTACLALRIAFSLVLTQNLSWLVLDEPTHNLDTQGVASLAKALRDHLPDLVEQVFIITHEDEMEAAVSGTLYRFERKKELDEPTKAVLISTAAQ